MFCDLDTANMVLRIAWSVVVRGASCGGRRGIGVQKDKHPNALYSRLQGVIWGHGSAGLSVGHAACRLLSLTKHIEAWCVVRG